MLQVSLGHQADRVLLLIFFRPPETRTSCISPAESYGVDRPGGVWDAEAVPELSGIPGLRFVFP